MMLLSQLFKSKHSRGTLRIKIHIKVLPRPPIKSKSRFTNVSLKIKILPVPLSKMKSYQSYPQNPIPNVTKATLKIKILLLLRPSLKSESKCKQSHYKIQNATKTNLKIQIKKVPKLTS